MKKIAVMGTGYVGLVSGTCFAEVGHQVICCDIDETKINKLLTGEIPIYEPGLEEVVKRNIEEKRLTFTTDIPSAIRDSEVIYIGVGTPMAPSGEADLTYVKNVAKTIGENLNGYKVVVNKSTVPVGTGKLVASIIKENLNEEIDFDVVSNPEFLREGSALYDTMNMERAVIGASSEKAATIIKEIHEPFNTTIISTNVESAEMIKYASNAFLATKISFINDIANICEKVGADVTKVAEGMGLDTRIGAKFLQAGIGYGGSCFPKDTQALVHIAEQVDYDFKLIKAVIETNQQQKMQVVKKLKEIFPSLAGKKIAVLGLAFKPNTDDMRDAPSLDIIPALLELGAEIKAFDPIAVEEAKHHFADRISYSTDLHSTIEGTDVAVILTDWKEVMEMDLNKVKQQLNNPILIDGRNCFDLSYAEEAGLIYHSIGRPQVNQ
ncbi:UDP-glucose/GDP-mannose dehydrogenase family protein [Sutcliffiella horikoshii]|uniref:UDP-glucose 6-dehydrogenase TuaD n=1 Tax=Sutcliffiella horikoshii TaxID=79883 RepID=UPI0007D06C3C|nr:UDP-glucose/GDP-mannose dehydrogenase family protein [Sutcliffiella horikoshii]MCM3618700.1 UDP-glucose/GDP-mannose dehydrogenase family protein [Sutcliffiella horikoshii]